MVYPEIAKLVEICNLFSCSMDELVRENMNISDEAYSDIRIETVKAFKEPMKAPFCLIPNAYKVLMTHMKVNGIAPKEDKKIISCFEKEYEKNGIPYMDVYIAIE